jgi:hypothetical protein
VRKMRREDEGRRWSESLKREGRRREARSARTAGLKVLEWPANMEPVFFKVRDGEGGTKGSRSCVVAEVVPGRSGR